MAIRRAGSASVLCFPLAVDGGNRFHVDGDRPAILVDLLGGVGGIAEGLDLDGGIAGFSVRVGRPISPTTSESDGREGTTFFQAELLFWWAWLNSGALPEVRGGPC